MRFLKILLLFFLPYSALAQSWDVISDFTILSDSSVFVLGSGAVTADFKYFGGNYYAFDTKGRILYDNYFKYRVYDYAIKDSIAKYEANAAKSNSSYKISQIFLVPLKEREVYLYGYTFGRRSDIHQVYIDQFGENKVENHTYQTGFFAAKSSDNVFHKILRQTMCSSVDTIKLHKEYFLTKDSSFIIGNETFIFSHKFWYSTLTCVRDKKIIWQQDLDGQLPNHSEKSPYKIIEFNNELYFVEHNDKRTISYLYRINKNGKIIWEISGKKVVIKQPEINFAAFPYYLDKRIPLINGLITKNIVWDNIVGDPRMLRKTYPKGGIIDSTYEYFYISGNFHYRKSWSKGKIHDEDIRYFADDGNTIYAEDDFNKGMIWQRKIYSGKNYNDKRPSEIFYFDAAGKLYSHVIYKNGYQREKTELFRQDTCYRIIYDGDFGGKESIAELKCKRDSFYYSQALYTLSVKIINTEGDTIKNAIVNFIIDSLQKPIKAVYDNKSQSYIVNIPAQKEILFVKIEAKGYLPSETYKYIPAFSKTLKQFSPLVIVIGKKKTPSFYTGNNYVYYQNNYDELIGVVLKKTDSTTRRIFLRQIERMGLEEDTSFMNEKKEVRTSHSGFSRRIGTYKNAGGVILRAKKSGDVTALITALGKDTLVLKAGHLLEAGPNLIIFLYDEAIICSSYQFKNDELQSLLAKYDFKLVKKNDYGTPIPSYQYDDSGNLIERDFGRTQSYVIQYTGENIDNMDKQLEKLQHNSLILSATHQRNRVQEYIMHTDY